MSDKTEGEKIYPLGYEPPETTESEREMRHVNTVRYTIK